MSSNDTIPVEVAVAEYLRATGYTPSHVPLVLAELDEPGTLPPTSAQWPFDSA